MFYLPMGLWMSNCCLVHMYVVSFAKVQELLTYELRVVIRDNGVWDSKSMDDVYKEQHGC